MSDSRPIDLVAGARPNFVKLAPVVRALHTLCPAVARIIHTGQHYDWSMNEVFFRDLGIPTPAVHLGVRASRQGAQTGRILERYEEHLISDPPAAVVVFGDVNSTVAAALAAVKLHVPLAHVEAGLRSHDRCMPEEINRIVCDSISDLLLVSEQSGIDNLMKEGVSSSKVHLVGNVMIDTLLRELPKAKQGDTLMRLGLSPRGYGLVTLHRPSNVDDPQVLRALLTVLARISVRLPLLFAMHPRTNKAVHDAGLEHLLDCRGLRTVTPLPYHENLALMDGAAVVLTDSGGMQEETTVLGVPCLTLRETTERPVTITNGTSRLVGKDPERILATLSEVLNTRDRSPRRIPLWDGNAGVRVASTLREWIGTN